MRKTLITRIAAVILSTLCLAAALTLGGPQGQTKAEAAPDNSRIAFDFFVRKGFTRAQSAGLVGNFVVESGKDPINPAAVQYGGGPGRGIAQWEGSRRTALFNYAAKRGMRWDNLQLQLDFVWLEMTGPERSAYNQIRATTSVSSAAVAVRKYYERPSAHADTARINAATRIYNRYAGGVVTPRPGESACPVLKSGSKGASVTTLQYLLRARGHKITPDGSFGPATLNAVKAYQKSQGLTQDGIVGPKTWGKLAPVLKSGAKGEAVKALQLELRAEGYSIAVDGSFGPATLNAVKAFQKKSNFTQDGIVGASTWGGLVD